MKVMDGGVKLTGYIQFPTKRGLAYIPREMNFNAPQCCALIWECDPVNGDKNGEYPVRQCSIRATVTHLRDADFCGNHYNHVVDKHCAK